MYPSTFKLQETYLSSNYILSLYNMKKTTDVKLHKLYDNIGVVSKKVIIDDSVIDTGLEFILSIAKDKKYIFISSDKHLLLVKNDEYEPKIIKKLTSPLLCKESILIVKKKSILWMNKILFFI